MAKKKVTNTAGRVRTSRKVLLAVLVLPAVAIATWFLFTQKQLETRDAAVAELDTVKTQLDTYNTKLTGITTNTAPKAAAYLDTARRLDRQLPADGDSLRSLDALDGIVKASGVTRNNLSVVSEGTSGNSVPISLSVTGSDFQVMNFLSAVQNAEPLMTVTGLALTYTENAETKVTDVAANMTVSVWKFPVPQLEDDPEVKALMGTVPPAGAPAPTTALPSANPLQPSSSGTLPPAPAPSAAPTLAPSTAPTLAPPEASASPAN